MAISHKVKLLLDIFMLLQLGTACWYLLTLQEYTPIMVTPIKKP